MPAPGAAYGSAEVRPPWPGEILELGGHRIHVRRGPHVSNAAVSNAAVSNAAGPSAPAPAVFVHGLGGSATNWTDLMGLLGDSVYGIAPDLPGFGWSPPPADGDYSIRAHAAAVIELIEHWGQGPVHLFGNSLGGAVSVRVAATRPDLVASLVLVSAALPRRRARRTNVHLPALATPLVGERLIRRFSQVAVERRVRASFALIYGDPKVLPGARFTEAVAEARRRGELPYESAALVGSLRSLLAGYVSLGRDAPWRLAAQVQAPTTLIYGLRDRLVDPASAARAVRTFPRASVTTLPGSGHVAQMEHPALVAGAVRRHLRWAASTLGTTVPAPSRRAVDVYRVVRIATVAVACAALALALTKGRARSRSVGDRRLSGVLRPKRR